MASPDDIWLVDFGKPFPAEPGLNRPAMVLGPRGDRDIRLPFVILVPFTTSRRELAFHVEVDADDVSGLSRVSYAQCELVRSVSRRRLMHRIGCVRPEIAESVRAIVRELIRP